MDKKYGYGQQQYRRGQRREAREKDTTFADRLEDGVDLLATSEDDQDDIPESRKFMSDFDNTEDRK